MFHVKHKYDRSSHHGKCMWAGPTHLKKIKLRQFVKYICVDDYASVAINKTNGGKYVQSNKMADRWNRGSLDCTKKTNTRRVV